MMENNINYTDEKEVERYNLKMIATSSSDWNETIAQFLQDTVPKRFGKYYLQAGKSKYNIGFDNLNSYIKALSALAKIKTDLYFIPCVFSDWRQDADAMYKNCVFVDIDNIDINLDQDDETIVNELKTRFPKIKQMMPCWIIKSGHGLHLYWHLEKQIDLRITDDFSKWQKATELLITYFHGDIACRNASRIMRLPTSYNCKKEAIKSKIIYYRQDEYEIEHFIDLLFNLDFDTYKQEQNAISNKKRKQTMAANGTKAGRKKSIHEKRYTNISPDLKIDFLEDYYIQKDEYKIIPSGRAASLLSDLVKWYKNRDGQIEGYRDHFAMMICNLHFMMNKPKHEAEFFVMQFFKDTDFEEEAQTIIEKYFNNRTQPYYYKNSTIAEIFDYTDEEMKSFNCNYTEADMKERKRKENIRLTEKRKAERDTAGKRQKRIEYIKNNPDKTNKELALALDVSKDTIKRLKKLL